MKQTAVDWYFDKIKSHFEHDGDLFETACFTYAIAKEKEKEQGMIPEISDIDIKKKRWEDWEEFNKKAGYSEDSASPYADGFTRGAKWVLEQLKH